MIDKKWLKWIGLMVAFGFLSLLDLGLNLISFIPFLNGWAESLSEVVLEGIQIVFFGWIALMVTMKGD